MAAPATDDVGQRNGFFYVLDRVTGQFLSGHPFVKVNWASGLDAKGRPIQTPQPEDARHTRASKARPIGIRRPTVPNGALLRIRLGGLGSVFVKEAQNYEEGPSFRGWQTHQSDSRRPECAVFAARSDQTYGRRLLATAPSLQWTAHRRKEVEVSHDRRHRQRILTTATDLLFAGGREGYFHALDARTGALLWKTSLGGQVASGPMTYQVDGKQYVTVAAGHSLFAFALRE